MNFYQAFPVVFKNEGGYANLANDTGGETYGGIARNKEPKWQGWPLLDKLKAQNGGYLPRYWKNAELDRIATDFYKQKYWDANQIDRFPAALRLSIFDMAVNGGAGAAWGVLRSAAGLTYSSSWDNSLLDIARRVTPEAYAAARKSFYEAVVRNNPKNAEFLKGWKERADHVFQVTSNWITSNPGISVVGALAVGTGLFFLIKSIRKKRGQR